MAKNFRKGQLIVHPQQGVLKLVKFQEKEIKGKKEAFFSLKPFFKSQGGLKLFIPESLLAKTGMRKICEKKVIFKGLREAAVFLKKSPELVREVNEEEALEQVKTADFKGMMILLGQLYFKMKVLKEQKIIEREVYKKLLSILSEELAAARKCAKKFAKKEILKRIEKALKKKSINTACGDRTRLSSFRG